MPLNNEENRGTRGGTCLLSSYLAKICVTVPRRLESLREFPKVAAAL